VVSELGTKGGLSRLAFPLEGGTGGHAQDRETKESIGVRSAKKPGSMTMRTRILVIFASVSVTVAVAIIHLVVTLPRRSLDHFLEEVATVEIGKTKFDDWHIQVQRAHLSNWNEICDQSKCRIVWRGENKLLRRLWLSPRTGVEVDVEFKDGIASGIDVWIEIDDASDVAGIMYPGTGVTVHEAKADQLCNSHYSSYVKLRGQQSWGVVTMDSCVFPEDRAKALAINTTCLTRIGGCKKVDEILPQVFGRR